MNKHTSHISIATWQLSRTTRGASSRVIHSFKWGNTSGVAIPPRASAASWRTISDSWGFCNTRRRDGIEWVDRSWPKTKAISCLCFVQLTRCSENWGSSAYLNKSLSSEKPEERASTADGVPILRRANMALYLSNKGSFLFNREVSNAVMADSETSSGVGWPPSSRDVGGAGSIEV